MTLFDIIVPAVALLLAGSIVLVVRFTASEPPPAE